jgi:signal transduction histidine kinase
VTPAGPGRTRQLGSWLWVELALSVLWTALALLLWDGNRHLVNGNELPVVALPTVTLGVYALLAARWRWPLEVFAIQVGFALAALTTRSYLPFVGLLVALHAVARRARLRVAVIAFTAAMAPLLWSAWRGALDRSNRSVPVGASLAIQGGLFALLAALPWALGRRSYRAEQQLRHQEALADAAAAELLVTERRRIATELHDSVTGALTSILLQAGGARRVQQHRDPEEAAVLAAIEEQGVRAMTEMRRLLRILSTDQPEPKEGEAPRATLEDLPSLVLRASTDGADVSLREVGTRGRLDPTVAVTAYRVCQESLLNAVKHGGSGVHVQLDLAWTADRLDIRVGSTPENVDHQETPSHLSSGLGLRGLHERVTLIGGTIAHHTSGPAFVVEASLPVAGSPDRQR